VALRNQPGGPRIIDKSSRGHFPQRVKSGESPTETGIGGSMEPEINHEALYRESIIATRALSVVATILSIVAVVVYMVPGA
jgi:hypothetical protein